MQNTENRLEDNRYIMQNRAENSMRNMLWATAHKIVGLIIPFFMRTLLIHLLGMEYVGLSTVFGSVLQVLSLAELGFGAAIVYALYKPIADEDTEKICALMNTFKKIYRIIAGIVLAVGISLTPFIPKLITGSIPDEVNIYVLYYIYLGNTVASYAMFAYRRVLFLAHQRQDIDDKISTAIQFFCYLAQAIFLFATKNYYLYVIVLPVQNILANIAIAIMASRKYPDYKPYGKLKSEEIKEISKKVKSLCFHKFGNTISNSFDSIIVSTFLGLQIVAMYGNYYYVVSVVLSFLTIFYTSIMASLGNSIATESVEINYCIFEKLSFLNFWVRTFCTTCLLCLYQPFMRIWAGDDNLLGVSSVICFSLYFYIFSGRKIVLTFKDAAGLWEADQWKPIVGGVFNLFVNICLVNTIGVNGVVISTILSHILVEIPWETCVLYKQYFNKKPIEYFLQCVIQLIISVCICVITFGVCRFVISNSIFALLVRAGICCIVSNLILVLLYHKDERFDYLMKTGKKVLHVKS